MKNHGVLHCIEMQVMKPKKPSGYDLLIKANHPEWTSEAIVTKYPDRFSAAAVSAARNSLAKSATTA
jgi:hypothetical protein